MNKYGKFTKGSFLKKLDILLKYKYKNENDVDLRFAKELVVYETGREIEELKATDTEVGNKRASIRRWRSYGDSWAKHYPSKIDILADICNVLDCDIDYFLRNEQTEFKKENVSATQRTGLSEKAIDMIANMDEKQKFIMDILLENGDMESILETLYQINASVGAIKIVNVDTGKMDYIKSDEAVKFAFANRIVKIADSLNAESRFVDYCNKLYKNHRKNKEIP